MSRIDTLGVVRLFDKKAEKTVWISILASVPLLCFVVWKETGEIGTTEVLIIIATLLVAIGTLYFVKWYSNKKQ
ncbi:MAG: hypothetical protein HEP71_13165 [Roseivirga sp.]|nr:hypothetical protein [Roseivirga sp.]